MDGEITVERLLIAAVGALATVVVTFWRQQQKQLDEIKSSQKRCQEDRDRLWSERESLMQRVTKLETECERLKHVTEH